MKTYPPWNEQQKHLKNGWLEYYFPFGARPIFTGYVGFKTQKLHQIFSCEFSRKNNPSTVTDSFGSSPSVCKTTGSEVACSDPIVCLGRLVDQKTHFPHLPWCATVHEHESTVAVRSWSSLNSLILGDKLIPPLIENHDNLYLNPYFWGLWPSSTMWKWWDPPTHICLRRICAIIWSKALFEILQYTVILWKDTRQKNSWQYTILTYI